jgi:hypothetical protein
MQGKKYRLWTFQAIDSVEELKNTGILQARWDRYSTTNQFVPPYRWMVQQMEQRNIPCNNHAPIWAWHSSMKYEQPPTLVEARCLLSDIEIEYGIQTIEFECPVELALLSSYRTWNVLLYDFFFCNDEANISKKLVNRLFATEKKQLKKYDCFQATLPYLKLEWVKDIRNLNLKPGDFTYNEEELV